MLNHRTIVLLKEEVTYNVDPTPTGAANALYVENPNWNLANVRMFERKPARTSQGKHKPLYAGALVEFKFDIEVKGSGAAGTAPELAAAMRSCGLAETIVAATSVTYKPASSAHKSCTIYMYRDGKLIKGTGCRGTMTGSCAVGAAIKFSFVFVGHFVSETDAALPTPTYLANTPPIFIAAPITVDSRTPALTKLDFDLGIEIARAENAVAADGYGEMQIVGRKVTGGFDDEDVLVATYNWMAKLASGAAVSIGTGVVGATAGNRVAITFGAATYTDTAPGDKSGIATRDIKFAAAEVTTDDEIAIAFT